VITGRKDKGKRGEVIKSCQKYSAWSFKVLICERNTNARCKHKADDYASIIEFEGPIHISNVMVVCPKCNEATRVGIQREEGGPAHRVCKNCENLID
jgi:large subunit ribosomal protein L24